VPPCGRPFPVPQAPARIRAFRMSIRHSILATAGHVDHGKSAVVRALSGIDPDRLPEEKARGITIELGFAHIDLPAPATWADETVPVPVSGSTGKQAGSAAARRADETGTGTVFRVGIVDVPGHEDFVKNMVAGVGSIDLALLVVSAKDGWKPQTEEHLQILTYLGVSRGVVALTMADLVPSIDAARLQVREKLRGTPLAEAPIVATSAVTGAGIEELKSTLASVLSQTPTQRDLGKPRLAVDRAFTMRGAGTVVTGTLTGGTLRKGQAVVIEPGSKAARIRSIQSYNREVEQATPGSRVALNLPDLQTGQNANPASAVSRGDVVVLPQLGRGSDTIDALIEVSAREAGTKPIKEGRLVRVHHGSGNSAAHVYFHGASAVAPGERVLAEFRFESPVFAFAGDRFIVRDWSEQQTLAGGIVLDPDAPRRRFRTPERRQFLQTRAEHPNDPVAFVSSALAQDGAIHKSSLLGKSRFDAADVERAVETLVGDGRAVVRGQWAADAAWWQRLHRESIDAIDAHHKSHPQEPGLRLVDLRQRLGRDAIHADLFDRLVDDLCREGGCARAGVAIRRSTHRPALPPHLQPAGAKLRAALAAKPLEPPSRKELTPDHPTVQALRFLLQSGEAIEIGDELVLHADHYHRAVDQIRAHIQKHGGASVSELRQVLNTSRRIMVPLLEKLDRDGVTLRQGDKRILKPARTATAT
jgi:selenocysteine-specific elongation factor